MTDRQNYLLGLLKEIDSLCRENQIDYYLTGGSLIGAIRHGGFIPWDDDMDIIMTRDNWHIFQGVFQKVMPKDRCLTGRSVECHTALDIAHYIDCNTSFISKYHVTNPEPAGLWIDILIMDPIVGDPACIRDYREALMESADLVNLYYHYAHRIGRDTEFPRFYERSREIGLEKTLEEITGKFFSQPEEACDCYIQRYAGATPVWKKSDYGKPCYLPFEDTFLPVPEKPYKCLVTGYGLEWMMIPQRSRERTDHSHLLVSETLPYSRILEDFEKHIDRKKMMELFVERKKSWSESNEFEFQIEKTQVMLAVEKVVLCYQKRLEGLEVETLVKAGEFERLEELFGDYFNIQENSQLVGNSQLKTWQQWYYRVYPRLVDIGDEAIFAAVSCLLHKDKLELARKILKARKLLDRPLTGQLQQLDKKFVKISACLSLWYEGDYQSCRKALEEDDLFGIRAAQRLDVLLLDKEGADTALVLEKAEALLAIHPDDPQVLSLLADYAWEEEAFVRVRDLYQKILEGRHHGLILLHMKERVLAFLKKAGESLPEEASKQWQSLLREIRLACGERAEAAEDIGRETGGSEKKEEKWSSCLDQPVAKRRFELLQEVDEICRKGKISYFLGGKTLLQAVRTGKLVNGNRELVLYMKADDFQQFASFVKEEDRKDRQLLLKKIGKKDRVISGAYKDLTTLDFVLDRKRKVELGSIGITIDILQPLAKRSFAGKGKAEKFTRQISEGKTRVYDGALFAKAGQVELEGQIFMTVSDPEKLLGAEEGRGWKSSAIKDLQIDPLQHIRTVEISPKEYEEHLRQKGITLEGIQEQWDRAKSKLNRSDSLAAKGYAYWVLMCASGERLAFAETLYPKKPLLRQLYKEKNYDLLAKEMGDYISRANWFLSKGLALYVDKEIEKYYCACLMHAGRRKRSLKMRCYVLKQRWKAVRE